MKRNFICNSHLILLLSKGLLCLLQPHAFLDLFARIRKKLRNFHQKVSELSCKSLGTFAVKSRDFFHVATNMSAKEPVHACSLMLCTNAPVRDKQVAKCMSGRHYSLLCKRSINRLHQRCFRYSRLLPAAWHPLGEFFVSPHILRVASYVRG